MVATDIPGKILDFQQSFLLFSINHGNVLPFATFQPRNYLSDATSCI